MNAKFISFDHFDVLARARNRLGACNPFLVFVCMCVCVCEQYAYAARLRAGQVVPNTRSFCPRKVVVWTIFTCRFIYVRFFYVATGRPDPQCLGFASALQKSGGQSLFMQRTKSRKEAASQV